MEMKKQTGLVFKMRVSPHAKPPANTIWDERKIYGQWRERIGLGDMVVEGGTQKNSQEIE